MGHLSIDYRNQEIRLLETEGSPKSLKVKNFRILQAYNGEEGAGESEVTVSSLEGTLGHVLSKERFTKDPAGMALGSSYCFFRDLELPFKNDDQIRKVIKFEVEGSIQVDIDDVVISYFKKTESIDKSYLLVAGAKKNVLTKQLEMLQGSDLDPYFIDLDLLCLYNALSGTGYLSELERFILVDCTAEATHILVLDQGRMISARTIPLGVGGAIRALNHDLKMNRIDLEGGAEPLMGILRESEIMVKSALEEEFEEAEGENGRTSHKASSTEIQKAKELADQRCSEFITKIKRELLRTLTFINLEDKPEKIMVTGTGCRIPGLMELLQDMFGAEVEELDILSKVDHSFSGDTATAVNREICVPLGAAYKVAGHDMTKVDFRQEDVRYTKKFDQIKVPLACFAFLLLILVVLLNLEQFMLRKSKKKEMDAITKLATYELGKALDETTDKTKLEAADEIANGYDWGLPRINGIYVSLDRENKRLGTELGREGTIPELPSAFPVWHHFSDMIEKHQDDFDLFKLSKVNIKMQQRTPTMDFDCIVGSGDDESNLERYLEEIPIFTKVTPGNSTPWKDGEGRVLKDVRVEIDLSKEVARK